MKINKLLFSIFLSIISSTSTSLSMQDYQWLDKNTVSIQDGRTFAQFETDFQAKYAHLTIPKIQLMDSKNITCGAYHAYDIKKPTEREIEALQDKYADIESTRNLMDCAKYTHKIRFSTEDLKFLTPEELEFVLLHETGHSTAPGIGGAIKCQSQYTIPAYVMALVGIHRKNPYKNNITKYLSKAIGLTCAPILSKETFNAVALRQEEKRADNFACTHADAQALRGGITLFKKTKFKYRPYIINPLEKVVIEALIDPTHPSLDSRIKKFQTTLTSRFGICP